MYDAVNQKSIYNEHLNGLERKCHSEMLRRKMSTNVINYLVYRKALLFDIK